MRRRSSVQNVQNPCGVQMYKKYEGRGAVRSTHDPCHRGRVFIRLHVINVYSFALMMTTLNHIQELSEPLVDDTERPQLPWVAPEKAPSDPASEDSVRQELPWETREESYVVTMADACHGKAVRHQNAADQCRKLFRALSAPTITLPLVAGTYNKFVPCNINDYALASLLLLSGLSAAASSFLDYGRRAAVHDDFAARYDELAGDIKNTMCRPKRFRPPCDVVLEQVRIRFASLERGAPPL
jgi:hypothetical protein